MFSKNKFRKVLREFKHGELRTHGAPVHARKQALAIAFSEARHPTRHHSSSGHKLVLSGSKAYVTRMAKHLKKEHPSTRRRLRIH